MLLYDIKVLSMFSKKPVPQIDMAKSTDFDTHTSSHTYLGQECKSVAKSYFENWNQLKIFILFGTYLHKNAVL